MISVRDRRFRKREGSSVEINMSPLIDLVFLLLIFFITTASFMKETGITVERPVARTAEEKKTSMLIGIDREGRVYIEGREVDPDAVRACVERFLAESPEGTVLVVADRKVPTGFLVRVMDECRLAGAKTVSLAASRESP